MERELMTIREAAEYLRVSPRTIYRLIEQGDLPVYRVSPRRLVVKRADLEALIRLIKVTK